MTAGYFEIYPADKDFKIIGTQALPIDPANLSKEEAVEIYFRLVANAPNPLPKEQVDLQSGIAELLGAVQQIYLRPSGAANDERSKEQFRSYYTRLFRLAQIGLEGANVSSEIAKSALDSMKDELIEDEAARVKNGHLKYLGLTASTMALPLIIIYVLLRLMPNGSLFDFLHKLGIEPITLANFMLLWVGCFLGVWLSYGIRTSVFTLKDLTVPDGDYLLPAMRLLFAGVLTMIIGIIFMLGMVKISVGSYAITDISKNAALAFLIGVFCGISELLLPATVGKQASDFIGEIK